MMVEILHLQQELHQVILAVAVVVQRLMENLHLKEELVELVQQQVLMEHLQLLLAVVVELIDAVEMLMILLEELVVEEEVVLDQDQVLFLSQQELTEQSTLVVAVVEENLNVLLHLQMEELMAELEQVVQELLLLGININS
tara:strand:- start:37 stop:459 length:423 start_codon:yes stop_codon:yes gene_type:complete